MRFHSMSTTIRQLSSLSSTIGTNSLSRPLSPLRPTRHLSSRRHALTRARTHTPAHKHARMHTRVQAVQDVARVAQQLLRLVMLSVKAGETVEAAERLDDLTREVRRVRRGSDVKWWEDDYVDWASLKRLSEGGDTCVQPAAAKLVRWHVRRRSKLGLLQRPTSQPSSKRSATAAAGDVRSLSPIIRP